MKIIIHFLHGFISKSRKQRKKGNKIRGGLLGGHIFFEVDKTIYGFETRNDDDFHIFPRKRAQEFNSIYRKEKLSEWNKRMKGNRMTSFELPLNTNNYQFLKHKLQEYSAQPPYDYAFFGMRCTASARHLLGKTDLFNSMKKRRAQIGYPYPRLLRRKLHKKAAKHNWAVNKSKGSEDKIWEG